MTRCSDLMRRDISSEKGVWEKSPYLSRCLSTKTFKGHIYSFGNRKPLIGFKKDDKFEV